VLLRIHSHGGAALFLRIGGATVRVFLVTPALFLRFIANFAAIKKLFPEI